MGSGRYKVLSQSVDDIAFYDVVVMDYIWKCSCSYHIHGQGRKCKHIVAVRNLVEHIQKMKNQVIEIEVPRDVIKCACCGNTQGNKLRERRKKKNGEISEMYKCACCGKKFVYAPGFKWRHYDADIITDALFHVAAGLSPPEDVTDKLEKKGFRPDQSTIHRWIKDYVKLLSVLKT